AGRHLAQRCAFGAAATPATKRARADLFRAASASVVLPLFGPIGANGVSNMRLAIVVQRYGVEVLGGAEDAVRALAEQLTALAEVHVIASCAKQYTSWANEDPAGISELNGVTVHRFPVDRPRDWSQAHKNNGRFLQEAHSLSEQM